MIHKMNLHDAPFQLIENKTKTIELRLCDEKRSKIKVGDIIEFTNTSNSSQKLEAKVTSIHFFDSFETLYQSLPLERCGYVAEEVKCAKASDMLKYYPKELQDLYGVLGIELQLI